MLQSQMLAALETLELCIAGCPEGQWQQSHGDAPFSQVVFHALFFTDYYLSDSDEEMKGRQFHRENPALFRDYEELRWERPRQTYTKAEILPYYGYCRQRVADYFTGLDDQALLSQAVRKKMSRLELALYLIRHIQHHAAQLGLRIQQITGDELKWIAQSAEGRLGSEISSSYHG